MRGFRRSRQGIATTFGADEAALVRVLATDLLALLAEEGPGSATPPDGADVDPLVALTGLGGPAPAPGRPDDPVLARLFPDAYRLDDDPAQAEAAADYRRFTTGDLRAGKEAGLRLVLDTLPERGGSVVLDEDGAAAWMTALTDLRLAIGARLEVTEEMLERRLPAADPRAPALEVFDFLGWLQETLVTAVADW